MYFVALATDYDGTIAEDGVVAEATLEALRELKQSGRKLLLVTGRQLPDLKMVLPEIALFDLVVAENGGILFDPKTSEETLLGPEPPQAFLDRLQAREVPVSAGRCIVATWEPHQNVVLEVIRDLGLELQIFFNKGAVMVLPAGIGKASGLEAALALLKLSQHNVVGIGDAENDHAFLRFCGCAVAVANALPMSKESADFMTEEPRGAGVAALARRMIAGDLAGLTQGLSRQAVELALDEAGAPIEISPRGESLLIAGISGGGKSTVATGLLERFLEGGFQFCVIDPEGDYAELENTASLGDAKHEPRLQEAVELLRHPKENLVINLLGVQLDERPRYFAKLIPQLCQLRAETARPHWILIDEAHHMMPPEWATAASLPQPLDGMILVTVHPEHVARAALETIALVVAVGSDPAAALRVFCGALGEDPPEIRDGQIERGLAYLWERRERRLRRVRINEPRQHLRRHTRKYAEGELGENRSFYFRGPDGVLNLRAQNLLLFLQIAEGVDDSTWLHHLQAGDYSRWLAESIKDPELASEVAMTEKNEALNAIESRARVKEAIDRRYTGAI
jgi:hydroxymethylpyrimidine pyrophosphatase-like HAD family hydrolase